MMPKKFYIIITWIIYDFAKYLEVQIKMLRMNTFTDIKLYVGVIITLSSKRKQQGFVAMGIMIRER